MSRPSCASTTCSAAATTSTRRGSRFSSTRPARRRSVARSRPSGSASGIQHWRCRSDEIRRIQAYFALPAALQPRPADSVVLDRARSADRGARPLGRTEYRPAPGQRPRHRHRLAEADRRHAGRRHRRPDGADRRPCRALQPRRNPREPRAEPHPAARGARRSAGRLRGARRGRSRHGRTPDWSPTSSPAPGSTTARWPTPARSRSPSAFPSGSSDHSAGKPRSATSRSRFPAASTPAAIIMSATSASSASRRRARSSTRSRLAAPATRRRRSARSSARVSPATRSSTRSKPSSTPISKNAKAPARISWQPTGASARRPSRKRSMAPVSAVALAFDPENGVRAEAAALNARYGALGARDVVDLAVHELFAGRIALVSSFGAESVGAPSHSFRGRSPPFR